MKKFIPYDLNQSVLLPNDLHAWLPPDHLVRFVVEVVGELDLAPIMESYTSSCGKPAYDPRMMLALLIYGYCTSVFSSRKLERATYESIAFRYLSGDQHPDHDTIAAFRERHLPVVKLLFIQVLKLCEKAGMVKLGHVAVDGTKIKAHAGKNKTFSHDHLVKRDAELKQQVEELLKKSQAADQADGQQNPEKFEDLPKELQRSQDRLQKIRDAKAALEAEAKERAAREVTAYDDRMAERAQKKADGKHVPGPPPNAPGKPEDAKPEPKAQGNTTDPDSRIMVNSGKSNGYVQAYNAQVVVDAEHQVIVATDFTTHGNDRLLLADMLAKVEENLGRKPEKASADAGYFSDKQINDARLSGIDLYVPPERHEIPPPPNDRNPPSPGASPPTQTPPSTPPSTPATPAAQRIALMRQKLQTHAGHMVYRMRKAIVEPVFGQIKHIRGFRQCSLRGRSKTSAEWTFIAITHNLLKLWRRRVA